MPIFDLHRHFEGSHSVETLLRTGQEFGIDGFLDRDHLTQNCVMIDDAAAEVSDEQRVDRFLNCMTAARAIYTSRVEIMEHLAMETSREALAQAPDGFELRFSLFSIVKQVLGKDQVLQWGVERIRDECARPILRALVAGCMRGAGNKARLRFGLSRGFEKKELAEKYRAVALLARDFRDDLCGLDVLSFGKPPLPPEPYLDEVFSLINQLRPDLPDLVIHAGEVLGAGGAQASIDSVRKALDHNPQAIGHGIWAVADSNLLREIADRGITLEVCPRSNKILAARGLSALLERTNGKPPLVCMLEAGVRCTVNSDDPGTFGTALAEDRAMAAGWGADLDVLDRHAEQRWNQIRVGRVVTPTLR